jgi:hypothetical protein
MAPLRGYGNGQIASSSFLQQQAGYAHRQASALSSFSYSIQLALNVLVVYLYVQHDKDGVVIPVRRCEVTSSSELPSRE